MFIFISKRQAVSLITTSVYFILSNNVSFAVASSSALIPSGNQTDFESANNPISFALHQMFDTGLSSEDDNLVHVFIPNSHVQEFERALFDRANENIAADHDGSDLSVEHRQLGYKKVHWCKSPYARKGGSYYRRMVDDDVFSEEFDNSENNRVEIIPSGGADVPEGFQTEADDQESGTRELEYGRKHQYRCHDAWKYGQYVGFRYRGKYYAYPPCFHYRASCSKSGCRHLYSGCSKSGCRGHGSACSYRSGSRKGGRGCSKSGCSYNSYDDYGYDHYYNRYSGSRRNLRGNDE